MKLKLSSLIIGMAAVTVLTTPMVANAQLNRPQSQEQLEETFRELNLTESQKAQLQNIKQETRSQMAEILSQEQQETLQNAIASGQSRREAMMSLNLSRNQMFKVRSFMQSEREKIKNVLTEEQRERLREEMESR